MRGESRRDLGTTKGRRRRGKEEGEDEVRRRGKGKGMGSGKGERAGRGFLVPARFYHPMA